MFRTTSSCWSSAATADFTCSTRKGFTDSQEKGAGDDRGFEPAWGLHILVAVFP